MGGLPPAGWYPDPDPTSRPGTQRWWDGTRWGTDLRTPDLPSDGAPWNPVPAAPPGGPDPRPTGPAPRRPVGLVAKLALWEARANRARIGWVVAAMCLLLLFSGIGGRDCPDQGYGDRRPIPTRVEGFPLRP